MKTLGRLVAAIALVGATLAVFGASGASARPMSACAGKGDECCVGQAGQPAAGTRVQSTQCPPPTIPEVPTSVLLPLSAGAVVGGVVLVNWRRRRARPSAA